MRVGYFPGCSLLGSSREFGESLRAVAPALGLELAEVPDWGCCGASSAHALDPLLAAALPARILSQAAGAGFEEVLAPCAACYNRLASARHQLEAVPAARARVDGVLGSGASESARRVRVLNILELLERLKDRIAAGVKQPLDRSVACYYGCLLVRPPRVVGAGRSEDPTSMDALVEACGGRALRWSFKTECCGAGLSVPRTSSVGRLAGRIVADATARKAELIVVACPMCHSNLDLRRGAIDAALGSAHAIPVLFVTQVIGLALGLPRRELGLDRHFVPVRLAEPAGVA